MKHFPSRRISVVITAAVLGACSGDMSDLEAKVAEVKSHKSTAIEPIPQVKQFDAFTYDPAGRRDPFAPVEPQKNTQGFSDSSLKPDLNRNKEPLEEFPLDALRMVGTITANGRTFAMVKAPDGVVHRVSANDHMGQNYGRITAVSESEVSLSELIPDGFGGWMQRPASLALAE